MTGTLLIGINKIPFTWGSCGGEFGPPRDLVLRMHIVSFATFWVRSKRLVICHFTGSSTSRRGARGRKRNESVTNCVRRSWHYLPLAAVAPNHSPPIYTISTRKAIGSGQIIPENMRASELTEIERVLRCHQEWILEDYEKAKDNYSSAYLRLAGSLRILLVDGDLPVLLHYAKEKGKGLYAYVEDSDLQSLEGKAVWSWSGFVATQCVLLGLV